MKGPIGSWLSWQLAVKEKVLDSVQRTEILT